MIILQHCCPACGASLAVAYSRSQLPTLTDELTAEGYEQARSELIASGLQFIVADEGKATCARCSTPINPRDLLAEILKQQGE